MRVFALSLLLGLAAVVPVRDASACKCVGRPFAEQLEGGEAVFAARLVAERHHGDDFEYTVEVDSVWRGTVKRTFVMHMGSNGGDCTMGQLEGKTWIFITDTQMHAHRCGGSREATPEVLAQVTKQLGAPRKPKS